VELKLDGEIAEKWEEVQEKTGGCCERSEAKCEQSERVGLQRS